MTKRKVILDLAVTLDGLIEGKNGEVDWCIMEPEMDFPKFLHQIDTILYGRKSFDLWGDYAPGEDATPEYMEMWDIVQQKEKYVFSRTKKYDDGKVHYINEPVGEVVQSLKSVPGKDIWLYGGAELITSFINEQLVDEFQLSVHPVVLGEGKPLFKDIQERVNLKLVKSRTFPSGVVQLIYSK